MIEFFMDGKIVKMGNYKRFIDVKTKNTENIMKVQDAELEILASSKKGGEWPILLLQQTQAMEIAFQVERQLL